MKLLHRWKEPPNKGELGGKVKTPPVGCRMAVLCLHHYMTIVI